MDGFLEGPSCEVHDFIVVDPFHKDAIDFDGVESDFLCSFNALDDLIQGASSGDAEKLFWREGIQADVEAVESCLFERFGEFVQEEAVGGAREVGDIFMFTDFFHEEREVSPQEGFSSGESHFFDAEICGDMDDSGYFFKGEEFFFRGYGIAFFWHTIDASEITSIGDTDAQIINGSSEAIFHSRTSLGSRRGLFLSGLAFQFFEDSTGSVCDFAIRDHAMASCTESVFPEFLIFMSCIGKNEGVLVFEFRYELLQDVGKIIEVDNSDISLRDGIRGCLGEDGIAFCGEGFPEAHGPEQVFIEEQDGHSQDLRGEVGKIFGGP